MSDRPALGPLKRGDRVVVTHRRDAAELYTVTGIGPTWLRAVLPYYFGDVLRERSYERRFLLADQKEGVPAKRYGLTPRFATIEQHAYDTETREAMRALTDRGVHPLAGGLLDDRDDMVRLANVLREMWPDA